MRPRVLIFRVHAWTVEAWVGNRRPLFYWRYGVISLGMGPFRRLEVRIGPFGLYAYRGMA